MTTQTMYKSIGSYPTGYQLLNINGIAKCILSHEMQLNLLIMLVFLQYDMQRNAIFAFRGQMVVLLFIERFSKGTIDLAEWTFCQINALHILWTFICRRFIPGGSLRTVFDYVRIPPWDSENMPRSLSRVQIES